MDGKVDNGILIGILVISLSLLFFANASAITGHAVSRNTFSNVSISSYYAVNWSANLTSGIIFEDIISLPVTDDNATGNWVDVPTDNSSGYWAIVDTDGNIPIDFCLHANGAMTTSGGGVIGLGNETYTSNVTSSNFTSPYIGDQIALQTSSTETSSDIYPGNYTYWRFWLDVPAAQEAGSYNNTLTFKAIAFSESC